jgi:hypothetical protein
MTPMYIEHVAEGTILKDFVESFTSTFWKDLDEIRASFC